VHRPYGQPYSATGAEKPAHRGRRRWRPGRSWRHGAAFIPRARGAVMSRPRSPYWLPIPRHTDLPNDW